MPASIDLAELEARLRQHVAKLARTPRIPGSQEHQQAAIYIRNHLEEAGFTVAETPLLGAGLTGTNLLTESSDADLPLFIMGAHYDTIPGSPGADDNASGVAALLELARLVGPVLQASQPRTARLQLVAYDLEEYGLLGSYTQSELLKEAAVSVRGMISLEMLGYTDQRPNSQRLPPELSRLYPHVGNFIGVCGNDASLGLVQMLTQALKGINGLPVEALAVPGNGEMLPETRLSDHSSFWDHGYQALMLTDTSFFRNPHYHQASDTPETLDYAFLARVTAGLLQAVPDLLK
jgi:Zn-dependent M28 family amino/carboxypeptidase